MQGLESIFTISYTSGTENNSKGAMLSNGNFLAAIASILKVAGDFPFSPDDVYMSYLPLAHVFDRLGVHASLSMGAGIGFFGGVILKIVDDLQLLRPTIFPSVPRLLNKVYDRIIAGVALIPRHRQLLFHTALSRKQSWLNYNGSVNNYKYDMLVFNKVKERLGGRIRVMITASAPIADNVLSFLKCAFCCPIVEAYGQTESCGASFSTKLYDNKTGHVGGPGITIECALRDVPELGYLSENKPNP